MAKAAADPSLETGIRLSRHPRARRHIGMAKAWGGLGAFLLVLFLSHKAGVPTADAVLRGIVGGIAGYLVAWIIAVTVWRQLAVAELERLRVMMLRDMERQALEAQARQAAAEGGQDTVRP